MTLAVSVVLLTLSRCNRHSSIVLTLVLSSELLNQTLVRFCSHWTYSSDEARHFNNAWLFLYCFVFAVWRRNLARQALQTGELTGLRFIKTARFTKMSWVSLLTFSVIFSAPSMFLRKQRSWLAQATGTWWWVMLCLQSVCSRRRVPRCE